MKTACVTRGRIRQTPRFYDGHGDLYLLGKSLVGEVPRQQIPGHGLKQQAVCVPCLPNKEAWEVRYLTTLGTAAHLLHGARQPPRL